MTRWLAIVLLLPALCWGQDELNSESGLVGRWLVPGWQTGNGAVPTKTLNLVPNGLDGGSSNAPIWAAISGRQSLKVNGTNQWVNIGQNGLYRLTNFTVSVWIFANKATTNNYQTILGTAVYGNNYGYAIGINTNMQLWGLVQSASVSSYIPSTGAGIGVQLQSQTWYHVAFSHYPSNLLLYVNGVSITSRSDSASVAYQSANALLIGRLPGSPPAVAYFGGGILDARIYNRVLKPSEIKSIYEQGLAPK